MTGLLTIRTRATIAWIGLLALLAGLLVVLPASPAHAAYSPNISIGNFEGDEGDGPLPTAFTFQVSVSPAPAADESVTVDYATFDFTARAGSDYQATSGSLMFGAGISSRTITVNVTGDTDLEDNELFFVGLTGSSAGTIVDGQGDGSILNDDGPTISIDDVTKSEGDSETTAFDFTVSLSGAYTQDTTVDYATSDGEAVAPDDYVATTGHLTIPAGETSGTVTVDVKGDEINEADETFDLVLSNAQGGATIADDTGVGTIVNDDAAVNLTVDDAAVIEGDPGLGSGPSLVFTVRAKGASEQAVSFQYRTVDGTATASSGDYVPTSSVLSQSITPGGTVDIQVPVNPDDTEEPFESMFLEITSATNAGIADDGRGEGVIQNDDATLTVASVETEEAAGDAAFPLTLSYPVATDVDVTFHAEDDDRDNVVPEARKGTDYADPEDTTVTIPAGGTTTTAPIAITNDDLDEFDEQYVFVVDSVSAGVDGAGSEAMGTILDDDAPPTVSILDASYPEGQAGVSARAVTVELSTPSGRDVTVGYATSDGSATVADDDYTAKTGTVTIPAGHDSATFTVSVKGDTKPETDEDLSIDLDPDTIDGATPGVGHATLTIENDDASVAVEDVSVAEGDAGTVGVDVTVRRGVTGADAPKVTFDWTTADSSADNAATAGDDYVAASGQGVIPAGEDSTTIHLTVNGDAVDETDEVFDVVLSNVVGAFVVDGTGEVTIADDDGVSLEVDDPEVVETDSGTTTLTFTVSLDGGTVGNDVTFDYATGDGTATASTLSPLLTGDYESASGSKTITAGDTSTTIDVTVNGDTDAEDDETLTLTISNVDDGGIGTKTDKPTGTGTILNDDVAFSISDAEVTEGDGGTRNLVFTVSTPYPSQDPATFDWATADGASQPATANIDYIAKDVTGATLAAGETETTLAVPVIGDAVDEPDETVDVTLSNPGTETIADGTGTGTIRDDDAAPRIDVADVTVTEGDSGAQDVAVTISLSGTSASDVTVDWATADGTAEAGSDYQEASGTATIAAGSTSTTVTIVVAGDTAPEDDETFRVDLANPENAVIRDGVGVVTIADDDTPANDPPAISAGPDRTVDTLADVTYEAATSDPDGDTVTVRWDFGDGTSAVAGNPVTHAFAAAGTYTVIVRATDARGASASDTVRVTVTDMAVIGRDYGSDRILTAIAVSQAHWPSRKTTAAASGSTAAATDAVLARSDLYPDALAAGPLTATLDAPLLLTPSNDLPDAVAAELDRLGVSTVWLLGGEAAISGTVEQQLEDLGYQVERVQGSTRFGTAAAVAERVGRTPAGEVVLALGAHPTPSRAWPDALSAGALTASSDRLPVLLTTQETLPQDTIDALASLRTTKVFITGGAAAVSDRVEEQLHDLGYTTQRLAGADRYATSVAVAAEALSRHADGQVPVVFATGANFPDGLAAGALAARAGGILVLVPPADLANATSVRDFLAEHADRLDAGTIVGGASAVSETVQNQLRAAMVAS